MHQPSQAMLDHLPPAAVFGEALTFLEGPGLLQERLLGMESHRTAFALSSCHALGPQGAYATDRRVELKTLDRIGLTQPVGPGAEGPQGVGNITGWAGDGAGRQVYLEVLFGEVVFSGTTRHLGY